MNRWRSALAGVGIVSLALAGWYLAARRGAPPPAIDLVEQFPQATKDHLLPLDQTFKVLSALVAGEAKPAILAYAPCRIIYHVDLPPGALLTVSLGVDPGVWNDRGDGVEFRIGVADGSAYEEMLTRVLDPWRSIADRRWIPVEIDLSRFAGRSVDLIFNTNPASPGHEVPASHDRALWGAPRIQGGR